MIQNKKSSKGITLISMILAVIVLMIIIGTISYSSRNSFQTRSLQNLYTDIDSMNDAVSVYYMKNKLLPIYTSYYDYNGDEQEYGYIILPNTYNSADNTYFFNFKEDGRDSDPSEKNIYFGIVDLDKISSTNLNEKNNLPDGIGSGNFFKPKAEGETSDFDNLKQSIKDGIFVMNMTTHKVYYTKGIQSDGKKYFARNVYSKGANYFAENDLINVPNFIKKDDEKSLDETILSQSEVEVPDDAIKVKFFANGGTGAPPEAIITSDMIEADPYLSSYIPDTVPTRTGMVFLGWAFSTNATSSKFYLTQIPSHGSYYTIVQVNGEDVRLPSSTYPTGSTINLYAIWKVSENVLLCYYPDDTGGIKPTISQYKVSRTSSIPDGVTNYLCVDIPSSGYILDWDWDYTQNDEKEALYEGTRTIDITNEDRYVSTEPGTIKIKGSFSNLTVSIENGDKFNFKINEKDLLDIYNTNSGMQRRDLVGGIVATQWLVGKNRAFTVPENPLSYKNMGIVDPTGYTGSTQYVDNLDTSAQYFLKKIVLIENSDNVSANSYDFENQSYRLGKVVELPDDTKTYCIYPYFASRNYQLASSNSENTKLYYQDNLQEVFDDSVELKDKQYDTITVLNNIKISKEQAEYLYEPRYDPACVDIVKFDKDNAITIYGNGCYINRQKNIQIGAVGVTTDVTINASSSSGIVFNSSGTNILMYGDGKLKLDGGCYISSNTTSNIIRMYGSTNLTILRANIENTNITDNTSPVISTWSAGTTVCIGCEQQSELNENDATKDSYITIKNPKGFVLDIDRGNFYWNYGVLKTKNVKYKGGYTAATEGYITTAGVSRKPCIELETTGNYSIGLNTRVWKFEDMDAGITREYYSSSLSKAHTMYNINNNDISTKTLTFTKDTMTINNDFATITKDVILDYNTDSSNYITSTNGQLIFNHNSTIKNCYMNLSTSTSNNGITIGQSGTVTLDLEYSDISFSNASTNKYCVYNNNGTFNFKTTARISGTGNGIYNHTNMLTNIWGDVDISNAACVNKGTIYLYNGGSLKATNSYALNNSGTATIYSYTSLSSAGTYTIGNSGTLTSGNYVTISNTNSSGYAVNNSSNLTMDSTSITATKYGLNNSKNATLRGTTINASTGIQNNSGGTLNLNNITMNASSYGIINKAALNVSGGTISALSSYVIDSQSSSAEAKFTSGNTTLSGKIRVKSGKVNFYESSGARLIANSSSNGYVYVQGGDFIMGYCDDDIRTNSPSVCGVSVTSGRFYFYDGNAGSLSAGGRVTIPTTSLPNEYVISNSGGAHIVTRTYDSPGTGNESYWQEGVHYNADGSTPYVDPDEEDDG